MTRPKNYSPWGKSKRHRKKLRPTLKQEVMKILGNYPQIEHVDLNSVFGMALDIKVKTSDANAERYFIEDFNSIHRLKKQRGNIISMIHSKNKIFRYLNKEFKR